MAALPLANPKPMPTEVRTKISGSMIGEAIQKAITGASGTPAASNEATSGITPQEQNGESAPTRDAATIAETGEPEKARAIRLSAPVAEK